MAFAELYGLSRDELTEVPHDITGEAIGELLQETFAIRRDGNALVARLAALLKEINQFNQDPPEQIDALYDYLGIHQFGLPLDELRAALADVSDLARDLAEALPERGIAVSFGPAGEP